MAVINSINIETFRGISNLKLDNLAEINILTGDNNSGKTSILEILQSLEEPDSFKIWRTLLRRGTFINRGLSYYEGFYDLFNINDEKKIIKYNVQSEEKNIKVVITADKSEEEVRIKPETEFFKESYSQLFEDGQMEFDRVEILSKLDLKLYINENKKDEMVLYENQIQISNENQELDNELKRNIVYISPIRHAEGGLFLNNVLDNPDLYEEMLDILKEYDDGIISINYDSKNERGMNRGVYISPIRHAEGGLFLNNVLDNPDLYEEMLDILKEYDDGIISINYDSKNERGMNRGVYKILSRSSQKALPLNVYGDGMKKAILLMSAVIKAKNGILLLDEFETAIHTSAMDKTFRWILQTCKKLNVQVFLTSHSKEAIDKILKCAPEMRKDMAVYTLSKVNEKSVARRLSGDKAIEVQDHMGLELR